jgi:opacity protein-like surface antigen
MKKILLSIATLVLTSQTALAAEPGSLILKAEGNYLLGDAQFKAAKGNDVLKPKNKNLDGIKGTISIGYLAAEDLWSDLALSYSSRKTKDDTTVTVTDPATPKFQKVEDETFGAMINGYYGFNSGSLLTPYITVGIGAKMTKSKITVPTTGIKLTTGGTALNNNASTAAVFSGLKVSKNTTYFAYQGGFGTRVNFNSTMGLNFGYRAANHQGGTFQGLETGASIKGSNSIEHNIFVGLELAL